MDRYIVATRRLVMMMFRCFSVNHRNVTDGLGSTCLSVQALDDIGGRFQKGASFGLFVKTCFFSKVFRVCDKSCGDSAQVNQ